MTEAALTEPSNAEIARRLDDVTRSVERVARSLEESYVRKEVYNARHEALKASTDAAVLGVQTDIVELREARKGELAFRRQILAGGAVVVIGVLFNLILATSNLVRIAGAG